MLQHIDPCNDPCNDQDLFVLVGFPLHGFALAWNLHPIGVQRRCDVFGCSESSVVDDAFGVVWSQLGISLETRPLEKRAWYLLHG